MSIDIVASEMKVHQKRERLVLMDDYGSTHHVYIPVSQAANRATIIAEHVALMQANQDAMEAYATAHGHDISNQKTAGTVTKTALLENLASVAAAALAQPAPAVAATTTTVPAVSSTTS